MEFLPILFVIIGIISWAIKAANKSSSKSDSPPVYRPSFPPLSVDAPAKVYTPAKNDTAQPLYYEGEQTGLQSRLNDPYAGAYDLSQPAAGGSLEGNTLEGGQGDASMTDIKPEIRPADIDLSELKPDIALKDGQGAAALPATPAFDRIQFLSSRSELAKAVVYSEILRPKFKSR